MIKEEEVEEEEEKLQRKQEDSKIAERKDVVLINP